jgi:hypothetical protein
LIGDFFERFSTLFSQCHCLLPRLPLVLHRWLGRLEPL